MRLTEHERERRRGPLPGDGGADNMRARRYLAKYTGQLPRRAD